MKERYYMSDLRWWIEHGDAAEALKVLPDGSVDALVTDPPAGIGFMGKEWDDFRRSRNPADAGRDSVHGRFSRSGPEYGRRDRQHFIDWLAGVLSECRRVMKPGAYGWVWAIPRTAHWTATACEDAGFAVRDVLVHVFGTGFPKSRSLLKPAQEMWISIQKPLAMGHWILTVSRQLRMLERDLCRTGDLQDAMGTVLSNEVISGCLSTVQSWNNTLAALWHGQSTFTTETVSSQITVLKTLNYSLSQITHESIIQERQNRSLLSVGAVEALFSVLRASLSSTQTLFAVESAIEKATFNAASANELQMDESEQKTGPGSEHWILIKAPGELRELRIEENRIGTTKQVPGSLSVKNQGVEGDCGLGKKKPTDSGQDVNTGRWPANFALSHSDDCADTCADDCAIRVLDEQSEGKMHSAGAARDGSTAVVADTYSASGYMLPPNRNMRRLGDSGGASRFFYRAKPSTKERSAGLVDGARNTHTTVKSISLMRHLVSLVAAPGATILDPFAGSGSTGIAALAEDCRFIGIEKETEYVEIARQRIAAEAAKTS